MKFFKALNIFAIILSFVCAAVAGCYVIWVGSKSNFQNGVAAILGLFLFAGIGVFGKLPERRTGQQGKRKTPILYAAFQSASSGVSGLVNLFAC